MGLNLWQILIRDEYKEFEKLIQEDLQDVDNCLEEEEVRTIIFFQVSHFIVPQIEPCMRYTNSICYYILQYDAADMIKEAETVEQR